MPPPPWTQPLWTLPHLRCLALAALLALAAAGAGLAQSRDSDAVANSTLDAGTAPPKSTAEKIAEIVDMIPDTPFAPPTKWEDVRDWLTKVAIYESGIDPDLIPDDTRDPRQVEAFKNDLRELGVQEAGFGNLEDLQRAIDEVQQGIDDAINIPGTDAIGITIDDDGSVAVEDVSSDDVLRDLRGAAPVSGSSGGSRQAIAAPAQIPGGPNAPRQAGPKPAQGAGIAMTDQPWSSLRVNPELFLLLPSR